MLANATTVDVTAEASTSSVGLIAGVSLMSFGFMIACWIRYGERCAYLPPKIIPLQQDATESATEDDESPPVLARDSGEYSQYFAEEDLKAAAEKNAPTRALHHGGEAGDEETQDEMIAEPFSAANSPERTPRRNRVNLSSSPTACVEAPAAAPAADAAGGTPLSPPPEPADGYAVEFSEQANGSAEAHDNTTDVESFRGSADSAAAAS